MLCKFWSAAKVKVELEGKRFALRDRGGEKVRFAGCQWESPDRQGKRVGLKACVELGVKGVLGAVKWLGFGGLLWSGTWLQLCDESDDGRSESTSSCLDGTNTQFGVLRRKRSVVLMFVSGIPIPTHVSVQRIRNIICTNMQTR